MARTTQVQLPPYFLTVRVGPTGAAFWEVAWRHRRPDGTSQNVKRRIGPAHVERDPESGEWRRPRARARNGFLDDRAAHLAADAVVREATAELVRREIEEREGRSEVPTFRQVTIDWLEFLRLVKGTRPSTLRDYENVLAEPGAPHRRGRGSSPGYVLRALGDRPAAEITTSQINAVLSKVAATGATASTVNKYRRVISSVFGWACKRPEYGVTSNPAVDADRRREPPRQPLDFYSVEEVEALARALAAGRHRDPGARSTSAPTDEQRRAEDAQDAELVRIAAYTGVRRGELLALRWGDVDYAGSRLILRRAVSDRQEVDGTKSGKVREVPLAAQAAQALARLQSRKHFTSPSDYVAISAFGDRLDGSALRRRVVAARDAAGLRPLRLHDLRHSFGSLLVAGGIDLVSIKAAYGHAKIETTERYLHARPASEQAARFTAALGGTGVGAQAPQTAGTASAKRSR